MYPLITLQGIYSKKIVKDIHNYLYTRMSTEMLFKTTATIMVKTASVCLHGLLSVYQTVQDASQAQAYLSLTIRQ